MSERRARAQDALTLAFDRATVRDYDRDGHLHIKEANLSKASVNPYRGSEIPNYEALGLDSSKIYKLLRDPKELERAAPSFNGKPLLFAHRPLTAETHDHDGTVGGIGETRYEHPYLKGKISVWSGPAIEAIESDEQKELSSAYRYDADMTPGEYDGEAYDGVMRNISGNHVALVKEGRAGPDCVVGDSIENLRSLDPMKVVLSRKAHVAQGALVAFLAPKLAQDAKIDWAPALKSVTDANFRDKQAALATDVMRQIKGRLAQDEAVELADVAKVLDAVASIGAPEPEKKDEPAAAQDDDREAKLREICGGKLGDDEIGKLLELMGPAAADSDLDADTTGKPKTPDGSVGAADADTDDEDDDEKRRKEKDAKDMVSKPAMDAAIKKAVAVATAETRADLAKTFRAIDEARDDIRPYVGNLKIAADSAEDVYKACLEARNIDLKGVHPSAFRAMVKMLPKASTEKRSLALDAAPSQSTTDTFAKMFPGAENIRIGA